MNERHIKRLEFERVKERLAGFAASEPGRELALNLTPLRDIDDINDALARVTEGREVLRLEPSARLDGWNDVREQARRCARGGVLEPLELWHVLQTLTASRLIASFFRERRDKYTRLSEIALGLGDFREAEKKISGAILPGGEISDRASEKLFSLRRRIIATQQRVKEKLDSIIKSTTYQKYLQDPIVTIRENRYVVPVKQEYRAQVPGIVHDQSASGATLFIEPMPVVEANNEVRTLMAEEKQEVARILQELSAAVGDVAEDLLYALEILGLLDFIMACARYSESLDALAPLVVPGAKLDIRKARHPLLPGKAVPISMRLGESFDMLVVTGPNTGGKTVALKTVGLMVVMAHAGLHLPADEDTIIGMYKDVFVDVGDEQSIEQSLSTFSSHMSNIVGILSQAESGSLVLLDELGAGTDPDEGAALAQAILDRLRELGAATVATTHYGELKNYAFTGERVENASVEFDPETLRPTYRLLIGRPGQSNAFEIALRLGLDQTVVRQARGYLTVEQREVADLMRDLEKARVQAERERDEAVKLRREAEEIREEYQALAEKIRIRRDEVISKAVAESRELVRRTRREADYLVEELKTSLKEESSRARDATIGDARRQLKKLQAELDQQAPDGGQRTDTQPPEVVRPGDEVFIPRYGQQGTVLDAPDRDGNVHVQVGMIRMTINRTELRDSTSKKNKQQETGTGKLVQQKARDISTRLDLRGTRVEDALNEVEKYLDDAVLAGLPVVYLIHGKGTGALRSAVQQLLREHPRVSFYRLGEQGEGGSGITVAELT
ncbi:MAG TPA: endonuclease MutS2 [Desulfotomaculum sp.]|nr:MAG: recombination and DNA strand exchange inhibitor protein [Desulfotomaculum sp. BICA1-6]HBX24563.1 endonuclease MutS2 [Desulfotomaculum sp.]